MVDLRHAAGLLRAFHQDVADVAGPRQRLLPALADRIEQGVDRDGQLGLDLDVADLAGAIPRLEVLDFVLVRVERVVVHEHRIALDRAGNVGPDALRIRVHLPHLVLHRLRVVRQVDGVVVALAHLPVVEAGQPRRRRQQRLRLDQVRRIEIVEAAHHFARQLEVRHLVVADRHPMCVVDGDVRGLQQRIAEEADARQIAVAQLLDLLLVRRHALEPRDRRHHLEQEVQLGVLGHERLDEERALLGVETGADPVRHVVDGVGDDLAGVVVVRRQRMPVDDAVERVVLGLQRDPVLQRADEVSEVKFSGRAHSRQHALLRH